MRFLPLLLLLIASHAIAQPASRVVLEAVSEQTLSPTTRLVGVLRFDRVSRLSPEVSGLIKTMRLSDGLHVKQGEVIAELSGDFVRQDIEIAKAEIGDVVAQIEQKQAELKRLGELRKSNVASRSAYDETRFELKALRARRKALGLRTQRLELELGRSQIRAPFDAVVLERQQDVGEWAKPETSMGRVAATDYVLAVFPLAETFMPYQQIGSEVEVTIPGLKKSIIGTVHGFVSTAEVRTRSAYLKIEIPYQPGMLENISVEAEIPTGATRTLRMIPRDALIQAPGKPTVYQVVDGKAVAVNFEIVSRKGEFVGTDSESITVGMQLVVDGNDRLRPGQAVEVVTADEVSASTPKTSGN